MASKIIAGLVGAMGLTNFLAATAVEEKLWQIALTLFGLLCSVMAFVAISFIKHISNHPKEPDLSNCVTKDTCNATSNGIQRQLQLMSKHMNVPMDEKFKAHCKSTQNYIYDKEEEETE